MKRLLVLSLLIFAGCNSKDRWSTHYVQADETQYASSKITYPALDKVNGMDVEMLMTQGKLYTYIHVHSQTLPVDPHNPKEIKLHIKTEEKIVEGIAYRHEGGQRALLSEALQTALIDALTKEKNVTLEVAGFSTELSSETFSDHFQELEKTPVKNPFHLPFKF